jgi:hypothetical protein
MIDWILNHVWPFTLYADIRRLEAACDSHFNFSQACLAYLDQMHSPWKHRRFNDKLYIIGPDSMKVMESGEANIIEYKDADCGIQELVAREGIVYADGSYRLGA